MNNTKVLMQRFQDKVRGKNKKIVLPEGYEPRTIKAAKQVKSLNLAYPILIGAKDVVLSKAEELGVDVIDIEIIEPTNFDKFDDYVQEFYQLRKHKGVSYDECKQSILDPVYFATMMLHMGDCDGLVAGAEHSTADTVRPALQIIKTIDSRSILSSIFIMVVPDCIYGENGVFVFGDCAIVPDPDEKQLAYIAISSANTAKKLLDIEPRVAMLSFSTAGSAQHLLVDKVKKATAIVKELAPDLAVDGEMQVDAALVPEVGKKKFPQSAVAGRANVLIFPDLQAGNCGYKLVERLAKASAIGPILQGLKKPVNDLSRGCSVDDIINVITITAVQSLK